MIDFMVIAAPRSATAWCANWLTTDDSLCLHCLSAEKHYTAWDEITGENGKMIGVSDTFIGRFPSWLNLHSSRKVIVHRDVRDISKSLDMDVSSIDFGLDKIKGMHVQYSDLFDSPQPIYEYLLQKVFDKHRHDLLRSLQVNVMAEKIKIDKSAFYRLIGELSHA